MTHDGGDSPSELASWLLRLPKRCNKITSVLQVTGSRALTIIEVSGKKVPSFAATSMSEKYSFRSEFLERQE